MPGAISGVVSNSQLNGRLVHSGTKFFIDIGDREEHVLAKCVKQSCSGPYEILAHETIGVAVHAEFCGPFLTGVALNQKTVFAQQPPTQADIDRDAQVRWEMGMVCLIYLAVVALYFTRRFVKWRRATAPTR